MKELFLGSSSVLQNTPSVFEMKMKQFHFLIVLISLIAIVIAGAIFLQTAEFDELKSYAESEVVQEQLASVLTQIPREAFIGIAVYGVFILFIIIFQFTRIAYIRIDTLQIHIKTVLDQKLGREGRLYMLTKPATLTSSVKGIGKNRHTLLTYTSPGGERKKLKLNIQVFGKQGIEALNKWVSDSKIAKDQF